MAAANLAPFWIRRQFAAIPLAGAVATRLLGSAGLQRIRVRGGPLDGATLECDIAHEKAIWTGTFEPDLQRVLDEVVRPEMVAWDVGAHIGFFSLILARRCSHVVAVEAHPGNAARLRNHVRLNDASVEVVQVAVSDRPGRVELLEGPGSGTHRLRHVAGPAWHQPNVGNLHYVEATTLDELGVRLGPPDLIKVDIEGAEGLALAGARTVLTRKPVVICETHGDASRREVIAALQRAGYKSVSDVGGRHVVAQ